MTIGDAGISVEAETARIVRQAVSTKVNPASR